MKSICCFLSILLGGVTTLFAQEDPILMQINGNQIPRSLFESYYNQEKEVSPTISLPEYVDCFVVLKLQAMAAVANGLDTLPDFRAAKDEYRYRLAREYLLGNEFIERATLQLYDQKKRATRDRQLYVSHIFNSLPQMVSEELLHETQSRFDSIYNALLADETDTLFETCVQRFSDRKEPFWVTALQVPVEFEQAVFELSPGSVSSPFFTPRGIHIVKVLESKEMPPIEEMKEELLEHITDSQDSAQEMKMRVETLKKAYHYVANESGVQELLSHGSTTQVLFTLDEKKYSGEDFAWFARAHPAASRFQWEHFVTKSLLDFGNSHLEQQNPEILLQLQYFQEKWLAGNVREQVVMEPARSDEMGLKNYFLTHRSDYYWPEEQYKGIVLHASTKRLAKRVRKFLKKLPEAEWNDAIRLTFTASDQLRVEPMQETFLPGDNPYVDEFVFKRGKASPLPSHPFTVVLGRKEKGPEEYGEVERERLLSDYQDYLEAQWILTLRAAGEVEIDQEVLKTVNKH